MSREHIHAPRHLGERASDTIAGLIGSWRFVLAQLAIIALWFAWNTLLLALAFDRYPFTFLNLFLSCEAAFATSLILISQNRQAVIDHRRDDHEAEEVDALFALNQQQIEILRHLRDNDTQHAEMLAAIHQLAAQRGPRDD